MLACKEWFYRLRQKVAYLICPEYFEDIEHRLSELLWYTTGGMLSKTNYTSDSMLRAVNDYQQKVCDECEYYLKCEKDGEGK